MRLTRRQILQGGAATAGLVFTGGTSTLFSTTAGAASGRPASARRNAVRSWANGYGDLVPDPAGVLDLPAGFTYQIVSESGGPLTGGAGVLPDAFDGSGLFDIDGRRFLVRNSEQWLPPDHEHHVIAALELTYDPAAVGGTTTTELDDAHGVVAEYFSLGGTVANCAGGKTPWATWLTCEETEWRTGENGLTKDHGFVFEVDPVNPFANLNPTPLYGLGRFAHEAAVIDPTTGIVYLSEDASEPNGLLYRALPSRPLGGWASLRAGASLEALVAKDGGTLVGDLSVYSDVGTVLSVGWVPVPDPLAVETYTRTQLDEVTRARKLEGMWFGDGAVHVVSSFARLGDGSAQEHDGQIWRLDPAASTLELVVRFGLNDAPESDAIDGPDNVTVSPWGGLLVCCDGAGAQHLFTVAPDGSTSIFARNARDASELTGANFSDDGSTLFFNMYDPGATFAVTGPFAGDDTGGTAPDTEATTP
ncbi:alkaline phosphatase PhoX [Desertimonas flava]|uniref:alkaline phosphatase PhoX n=1 Tax=Desertimonas flava TaxID=2064846 RepID=UPI000E348A48|nr:alkaline phosphatase PhoX [Desertimonas flava]